MVRTQGFHPCNMGSIPVGASNYQDVDLAWIALKDYIYTAIKCECKLLSRTSKLNRVKRTGRSLSTKSSRRTHYRIACKNFGYNLEAREQLVTHFS